MCDDVLSSSKLNLLFTLSSWKLYVEYNNRGFSVLNNLYPHGLTPLITPKKTKTILCSIKIVIYFNSN